MSAEISEIHQQVFKRFKWQPDETTFGVKEHWGLPKEEGDLLVGDCDNFAYAVFTKLKEVGETPRLMFCKTEQDEYHLVCECGGWVSDNRHRWVKTVLGLESRGYTFLAFSDISGGDKWVQYTGVM